MGDPGLAGKAIVITGAGAGIGRVTAEQLAAEGARLMLGDIDADAAESTARAIRAAGGEARAQRVDVTRDDQVAALVEATLDAYGGLDGAFNNAGIEEENHKVAEVDEALFDRVMAINVKGVWLCMKHQTAAMAAHGGGSIVNTASVAGLVGAPRKAAYAGSKHAVVGMTKSVAAEYARQGIRVNTVCPGIIRTAMMERAIEQAARAGYASEEKQRQFHAAMHPMGRVGEAGEVAEAVRWLLSGASSFVTGHQLAVDGGLTAL
ncbi:short chain dehydrogenase [Alcanivorax sp. 521-1]|uniref:Short chain dehydrogenase n=1 Tax=Alloalcanivorax profundimaris TaxID=2735259 RepID=A0ABS0AV88_9GAMM|nr:glucose 1-dehydrogenase [Alloalcanivorax profundimaris]MBF5058032.1 short chain dehydrogenase [Alloalcanivorax profundimaris]MBM1144286.1 glucose 1-dehydrogenase [Alcanivorax sp. ZXX171]